MMAIAARSGASLAIFMGLFRSCSMSMPPRTSFEPKWFADAANPLGRAMGRGPRRGLPAPTTKRQASRTTTR